MNPEITKLNITSAIFPNGAWVEGKYTVEVNGKFHDGVCKWIKHLAEDIFVICIYYRNEYDLYVVKGFKDIVTEDNKL